MLSHFYESFSEFIKLFRESDYDEGYLYGGGTSVTRAYWSFLRATKDDVDNAQG